MTNPSIFAPGQYGVPTVREMTGDETLARVPATGELKAAIMGERNRRLRLPFTFQTKLYDRSADSVSRIAGAGTLALAAIMNGAQPGNLNWHGDPVNPFGWIAADNTVTTMDAQTMFAFGQTCAQVETKLVFAARALKDMNPIPADYAADVYWT